jgi:hypothetical protein
MPPLSPKTDFKKGEAKEHSLIPFPYSYLSIPLRYSAVPGRRSGTPLSAAARVGASRRSPSPSASRVRWLKSPTICATSRQARSSKPRSRSGCQSFSVIRVGVALNFSARVHNARSRGERSGTSRQRRCLMASTNAGSPRSTRRNSACDTVQ